MKAAPRPRKIRATIRDQQEHIRFNKNKDPQFEKGSRFAKRTPVKTKTGLLSGQ